MLPFWKNNCSPFGLYISAWRPNLCVDILCHPKKITDNVYKGVFSIDSILFPDWDAIINEITLTERTSAQKRWCFKRRSVLFLVTSLGGDLFYYFLFFLGGV